MTGSRSVCSTLAGMSLSVPEAALQIGKLLRPRTLSVKSVVNKCNISTVIPQAPYHSMESCNKAHVKRSFITTMSYNSPAPLQEL